MTYRSIALALTAGLTLALGACGGGNSAKIAVQEVEGGVNPYLWRASLDTLGFLPLEHTDSFSGVIRFDWFAFPESPGERVKATVFVLDTRLRADGVKVSVFRQTNDGSGWVDANVDPGTSIQLENRILERARNLKASEIS